MSNLLPSDRESTETHSNSPSTPEMILSTPQQQALDWLANGGSITEAAQFAGVNRATVYRWLRDDMDFLTAYDEWRSQSIELAKDRMVALTESALDNLTAAVRERRDLRASEFVLKQLKIAAR